MKQDTLVGIDLATTMSAIARLDPTGAAVTIPNGLGEPLTPSVVYFEGSTALVGKAAKDAAAVDSAKAAMFVKRDMGEKLHWTPMLRLYNELGQLSISLKAKSRALPKSFGT